MASSTLITDYMQYGTHAARPVTPNTPTNCAPLYFETDTLKLFIWDGAWVQVSGTGTGGGLFAPTLTTVPTSAGTGLTTWLNQGTASVADSTAGMCITAATAASLSVHCRTKAVPATPYVVKALLSYTSDYTGSGAWAGIGWYNGTDKLHLFGPNYATSSGNVLLVGKLTNFSTYSANDTAVGFATPSLLWLSIADDGTNIIFSYSLDGANYVTVQSQAYAATWMGAGAYTNLVFFANPQAGAMQATLMSYVD